MDIIKATENDTNDIYNIVYSSIEYAYSKCYDRSIVDFFHKIHSKENISKDIKNGTHIIAIKDGIKIGTGYIKDDHISRVYILPEYMGAGAGSLIMDYLETLAKKNFNFVLLDPSLCAENFYKKRGYKTISSEVCKFPDGSVLPHVIMKKELKNKTLTD